jgi:hypothetical protein
MYNQEKTITEDLAVWARPFAFHAYGKFTKKKEAITDIRFFIVVTVLIRQTPLNTVFSKIPTYYRNSIPKILQTLTIICLWY